MAVSITGPQRGWRLRRFLTAFFWAVVWCGGGLAAIEYFYGPGASSSFYLMGGAAAVFLVAVPVSLGFLLAAFLGLLCWRGRLKKQIRRYLSPEESRDPIRVVESDLKCRLYGVSDILLGKDWVVVPGGAMKRDALVGIYYTNLDRYPFPFRKKVRLTLVDEAGEMISCLTPWKDGPVYYHYLKTVHPWVSQGDFREYTFFLRKEGEQPDRRKLRQPTPPAPRGVSRWDRSPILEENPVVWEYERWLLASYAPYIAADPYRHGDFDHLGGWERTVLQQDIAREILSEMWEVSGKEELLDTVEHLVVTGRMGRDGWQLGRATMVLGFGYTAGYINREELLMASLPAGEAIQEVFSSWQELHEDYLKSYEQWSTGYKSNHLRREACKALLLDPGSILNTVAFRLDLPGRCREAVGDAFRGEGNTIC